jgi:hypothetical protein
MLKRNAFDDKLKIKQNTKDVFPSSQPFPKTIKIQLRKFVSNSARKLL